MIALQERERPKLKKRAYQGYRMIETIEIKNFRAFDRVELNDLKTVNVIVGRNASGKTALLEAMYFTLGSPTLAFKIRNWRGLGVEVRYDESTASKNAIWRDLFYNFDQSNAVSIAFKGTPNITRKVRIECSDKSSQLVSKGLGGSVIKQIPAIKFEYFRKDKHLATVYPTFSEAGIRLSGTLEPLSGAFFPSNVPIDQEEIALYFSELSRKHSAQPVIDEMGELFDFIKDLSLELLGKSSMIYGSIKGKEEKIPIGLISTGITKILAYLLAIASQKGGIVIIDEIENGFYFDTMPKIWKSLYKFAKLYDVQLFISTHSAECLQALKKAMLGNEQDFSLLRTMRDEKRSTIAHFQGEQLLSALEEHIEIR